MWRSPFCLIVQSCFKQKHRAYLSWPLGTLTLFWRLPWVFGLFIDSVCISCAQNCIVGYFTGSKLLQQIKFLLSFVFRMFQFFKKSFPNINFQLLFGFSFTFTLLLNLIFYLNLFLLLGLSGTANEILPETSCAQHELYELLLLHISFSQVRSFGKCLCWYSLPLFSITLQFWALNDKLSKRKQV